MTWEALISRRAISGRPSSCVVECRIRLVHQRDRVDIELPRPLRPKGNDPVQTRLALDDQAPGLDPQAAGHEAARLGDAVAQEQDRAAVVAVAGVVETDADLEDAL